VLTLQLGNRLGGLLSQVQSYHSCSCVHTQIIVSSSRRWGLVCIMKPQVVVANLPPFLERVQSVDIRDCIPVIIKQKKIPLSPTDATSIPPLLVLNRVEPPTDFSRRERRAKHPTLARQFP
jgi:hypothetical protein